MRLLLGADLSTLSGCWTAALALGAARAATVLPMTILVIICLRLLTLNNSPIPGTCVRGIDVCDRLL
jgi:hypothetical protein